MRAAAQRLDEAAEIVLDALDVRLQFDGAVAGRSHAEAGWGVRTAMDRLIADVRHWATTAGEVADALRAGADGAVAAESAATAKLR